MHHQRINIYHQYGKTVQEVLHEAIPKKYLHKKYGGDMKNIPGLHGFKLLSYVEEEEEPMADKV